MLEKMFGVRLVSKLRAILLMEADFNAMNKEVYGVRMLDKAQKHKLIPEEIFSKKNRTANDRGFTKLLFYNILHQTHSAVAIALVDASNCYDRIAHAMSSLIFQSFGVESTAVLDENFLANSIWGLKDICQLHHQEQDTGAGTRQWGIPCRVVCDQHYNITGAWSKGAWCTFPCTDIPGSKQLICYIVCL
jgi:hypothetical protein